MKDIVVNTLVFAQEYNKGMEQIKMIELLEVAGYKKIEVRREYFKGIENEMFLVGEYVLRNNVELFYSIPEPLYNDGVLNTSEITTYFKEAKTMLCTHVKMIIGNYQDVKLEDVLFINKLSMKYDINLTVENDQTTSNGSAPYIFNFVTKFKDKGGQIGVTFDVGNWIWVNEDPLENAKKLAPFVTYLHLKDVSGKENPLPTYLNQGIIDWKAIMHALPAGIPVALEYPMGEHIIEDLNSQYDVFKSYKK